MSTHATGSAGAGAAHAAAAGTLAHAAAHAAGRVAHAAGHGATAAAKVSPAPDISVGHVLLQMVLALAVVVGGIWGFSKILGKGRGKGAFASLGGRRPATQELVVLSRQSLGKGLSIASVRWGDREVLVGISGTTITFLNGAESGNGAESLNGGDSGNGAESLNGGDSGNGAESGDGAESGSVVPVYDPPFEPPAVGRASMPVRQGLPWTIQSPPLSRATAEPGSRPSFLQSLRDATTRR